VVAGLRGRAGGAPPLRFALYTLRDTPVPPAPSTLTVGARETLIPPGGGMYPAAVAVVLISSGKSGGGDSGSGGRRV
jgi:hypothetical protein